MKNIKNIITYSLFAVAISLGSCSDFLDVNNDPNRVTGDNITPDLIFTQAENAVGQRQATRFVFMNNWMGYWSRSGTFIVEQEETTYKVANTFTENNWDQAYNILFDLRQVETRAIAANDSVLAGAAMVLSAKLWQETVDMFGAIPYTQAFDQVKYPRPAYDKATDIYADQLVKLDKAITLLNAVKPKSTFSKADIIFARGGSVGTAVTKWKKFANTIKLRIYLRQSEKAAPTPAQIAKLTADGGFLGSGENVSINPGYSNQTDKQNPFYAAFGKTAAGAPATTNNKPNNYFVKIVLGNSDPRLARYFATPVAGTDYGALGGNKTPGGATIVGTEIGPGLAGSSEQDQFLMPAFESLFFQAEATARGWLSGGDAAAKTLFEDAIKQSFAWLGVTDASTAATTYMTNVPSANWTNSGTTVSDKVKFIAYQKYVALCGIDAIESWSDLRRGVLVLPAGYLSNNAVRAAGLPYVLPYPQTEITTNNDNLPARSKDQIFTEKLFWMP